MQACIFHVIGRSNHQFSEEKRKVNDVSREQWKASFTRNNIKQAKHLISFMPNLRRLSLHQQNFTLGFRHKPWASWHICTSGAWWTLLMWCLQQQANYAHHQHTWVAAKTVLQTWYNKQAENRRADDFVTEGSTDSFPFFSLSITRRRDPPVLFSHGTE